MDVIEKEFRRREGSRSPDRPVVLRHLSHRPHRICRWREGPAGEGGARRDLRHARGHVRRAKGEKKEKERVVGKAAGDERVFIPGRGGRGGR
jgi:hypothetical protein